MENIFTFFLDYLKSELEIINHNLHNPMNPGYTYLMLAVLIKLYRKSLKND
jgi:hypothetical protein